MGGPSVSDRPFGFRILGSADEPPDGLLRRAQALVTVAIVAANVVGALIVMALNVWVIPGPGLLDTPRRSLAFVLTPTYLVGAVLVGVWFGTRRELGRLRWAREGGFPSPAQQQDALRAPSRLLIVQLVLWAGAVGVFGGLAATAGSSRVVLRSVLTVALGGVVTCGYAYLLSEVALRPVAARALSRRGPVESAIPGLGIRNVLVWVVGTGVPAAGLMTVAAGVLIYGEVSADTLAWTVLGLGAVTVAAGLALLALATRAVTDPLGDLTGALGRVQEGDLSTRIVVYDGTEIGRVQAQFNHMVSGLEERERLQDLFSRHVGDEVARAALERGTQMGGEECEASAVFVDIVGSTALAQHSSPKAVVAVLNRFFEHVVNAVEAHGGWVNKFEGDAALCVFGPPTGLVGHADAALRAVRDLRQRLEVLASEDGTKAGIGVASGLVIAGNVGARDRYEYTVIGDAVNTAARLTELAKDTDTGVLAAATAVARAADDERSRWHEIDRVVVRGRSEPTVLFTARCHSEDSGISAPMPGRSGPSTSHGPPTLAPSGHGRGDVPADRRGPREHRRVGQR